MKKYNKKINVFTFILLAASFLFVPVNLVMADDTSSEKTTSDSDKDVDKKKKEKDKDKKDDGEEEPDCE